MRRLAAIALLAAGALPALAQTDAVLINATRFPEDAQRLPASVTVISAEDIQKSAARTLPELLQEQAGVTMKDFYGNNAAATPQPAVNNSDKPAAARFIPARFASGIAS